MAEFVQVGGNGEGLFLPAQLAAQVGSAAQDPASRSGAEIAALGEQEVVATLTTARSMRARADALEAHALVRLDRLRGRDRYVADEAALELRISRRAAGARVARAHALTGRMPRLLGSWSPGRWKVSRRARSPT